MTYISPEDAHGLDWQAKTLQHLVDRQARAAWATKSAVMQHAARELYDRARTDPALATGLLFAGIASTLRALRREAEGNKRQQESQAAAP
jgi:hypothetical protein